MKNENFPIAEAENDTFKKFGGGGKSLKKYLTDKKIPAEERKKIPLICRENEVLAIFGTEISESVKLTNNAKEKAFLAYIYIK